MSNRIPIAVVMSLLSFIAITLPAYAQTYSISITASDVRCLSMYGEAVTSLKYALTINGASVTARSEGGSGFTTNVSPDGSFKAEFRSVSSGQMLVAEGNITSGRRTLKVLNKKSACAMEGKE